MSHFPGYLSSLFPHSITECWDGRWGQSENSEQRDSKIVDGASILRKEVKKRFMYLSFCTFRRNWKGQRNNKPIRYKMFKQRTQKIVFKYCARFSRCAWNWNYKDETFDKWLFRSSNSIKFMGDLQITTLFSAQYFGCKVQNPESSKISVCRPCCIF